MDASIFFYDELLSGDEIRLIHIESGSGNDQIRINLEITPIGAHDKGPKYRALSYVWDKSPNRKLIVCNDSQLEVRENLYDALWQIREDGETDIPWWVDAICINQANDLEKTQQVQMMKDIYAKAFSVRAWLGRATEQDAAGFALLRTIYDQHGHYSKDSTRLFMEDLTRPLRHDTLQELGLPLLQDPQWRATADILWREYFRRIWIVQEILVAQRCTIRCGIHSIDREVLFAVGALYGMFSSIKMALQTNVPLERFGQQDAASRPFDLDKFRETMATQSVPTIDNTSSGIFFAVGALWLFSTNRTKDGKWKDGGLPLVTLLGKTAQFKASDDRDKIFALIGLASDISKSIIDYSKRLDDIQIEVAQICIKQHDWGPMLFTNVNPIGHSTALPSWVPDWVGAPVVNSSLAAYRYWEPNYTGSVWWTIDSRNVIRLRGRIFDTVGRVIHRQPYHAITAYLTDTEISLRHAQELDRWNRECWDLVKPLARYQTGESQFDAVWRTMVFNREAKGVAAPDELGFSYIWWVTGIQAVVYMIEEILSSAERTYLEYDNWTKFKITFFMGWMCIAFPLSQRFESALNQNAIGRKFFMSKNEFIGWVPTAAQEGDMLCLFEHCWLPFVIRPTPDGYQLIGEAYVHGVMDKQPEQVQRMPFKIIKLI